MMGVVKRWNEARGAAVIAECGTGKTLISLGAVHVHSDRRPFTALAMVPPQLVEKWAREALLTLPRVRVFFIDGLRGPTSSVAHAGVNEVRLRHGRIVREGLRTTLTELRQRKTSRTARARWDSICGLPALFIVGRDRGKLSYFWRHAYGLARCGRYQGSVVNADSGCPIYLNGDGERLLSDRLRKAKLSEMLGGTKGEEPAKLRRALYSALWQADGKKVRRFAPVDFIGRYMPNFFDYAIADEVHELKGDTAQGNALGTLAGCAQRTVVLTGTLLGGYADELFNILFRLQPAKMVGEGFECGEAGLRSFTETYGLLEKITVIEPSDNACSDGSRNQTHSPSPWRLAASLRPLPHESWSIHFARRHFRGPATLSRRSHQRGDGSCSARCLQEAGRGHQEGFAGTSAQPDCNERGAQRIAPLSGPAVWAR